MAETIHYVTVQLVAPCASYPYGKIEEGYYRLDGDTVVLVNAKGVQRTDKKGKAITHKLRSGETLRAVAWRLTKQYAPNRRPSFNGPLRYFNPGKI